MLFRLRAAKLLLPTVLTLAALGVLAGLGTWQLQRKAWKDGIIAGLKDGTRRPPIPYTSWLKSAETQSNAASRWHIDGPEFVRVAATGRFQHEHESYAYTVRNSRPGYAVFTPLSMADGRIVVVNRGFVPQEMREPAKRPETLPAGEVTVHGITRKPAVPSYFTPPYDSSQRISFSGSAGQHPKLGSPEAPAGVYIEAEPTSGASSWPRPRSADELLAIIPNRHLEYALTWYGLAATLIGVFLTFAAGRLRAPPQVATREPPETRRARPEGAGD